MNILVTGGNGFLGSNITKKLIHKNHRVLIASKHNNNIQFEYNKYKFIPAYMDTIHEHIDEIKCFLPDVILLFGWNGANSYQDINSIDQFYKNLPDHIRFLTLISKFKHKPKIIGVGSFAEYGDYNTLITEEYFEKPSSLYGISKFAFKQYSEFYCKQNGINWKWIRPCYTYGPNDVIYLGECNAILDYLYIDDFVNFVDELISSDECGVYNICSGNQYKLKDVVNTLHRLTNSKSKVVFDKKLNRKGSSNFLCGDNAKIKSLTNIYKLIDIELGLFRTIEFYERQNNIKI
jgi:nucleoside-diphosphate-sugar epimerase